MNFESMQEWYLYLKTWEFVIGLSLLPITLPLCIWLSYRKNKRIDKLCKKLEEI